MGLFQLTQVLGEGGDKLPRDWVAEARARHGGDSRDMAMIVVTPTIVAILWVMGLLMTCDCY